MSVPITDPRPPVRLAPPRNAAVAITISRPMAPCGSIAPMIDAKAHMTTYDVVIANAADTPHQGSGEPVSRSALVEHITPELARAAARLLASGGSSFLQFRAVGGAVSDVADDATAYAHRSAGFAVAAFGASDATIDPGWADALGGPEWLKPASAVAAIAILVE